MDIELKSLSSLYEKTGRVLGFGECCDIINAKVDQCGLSGEYNKGYRQALYDVTAELLKRLKQENA